MNGFNMAFKWRGRAYDPTSFTVEPLLIQSEDSGANINAISLNVVACTADMFPASLATQLGVLSITDWVCIDPLQYANILFKQNDHGSNYSYVDIRLTKCDSG